MIPNSIFFQFLLARVRQLFFRKVKPQLGTVGFVQFSIEYCWFLDIGSAHPGHIQYLDSMLLEFTTCTTGTRVPNTCSAARTVMRRISQIAAQHPASSSVRTSVRTRTRVPGQDDRMWYRYEDSSTGIFSLCSGAYIWISLTKYALLCDAISRSCKFDGVVSTHKTASDGGRFQSTTRTGTTLSRTSYFVWYSRD